LALLEETAAYRAYWQEADATRLVNSERPTGLAGRAIG
jgi:hypothetical protein